MTRLSSPSASLRDISIETLPRTRSATISRFVSLGIHTYWDLLNHIPSRYEDYTQIYPIVKAPVGTACTIQGRITSFDQTFTRNKMTIQRVTIVDETGEITASWFNQRYLSQVLREGLDISLAGTVKQFGKKRSFEPSSYELFSQGIGTCVHTARLVPVYPETRGLSSRTIRDKVHMLLQEYVKSGDYDDDFDWLPAEIEKKYHLYDEKKAYEYIHAPSSLAVVEKARSRLAFDELFVIQLSAGLTKKEWHTEQVSHQFRPVSLTSAQMQPFMQALPFSLTSAQQRCAEEILTDLSRPFPMNRFLQGDVGSGKTVVAAIAAYVAHLNGYQTLLMAPTEILAQQHYESLQRVLGPLSLSLGLQTRSTKMIQKGEQRVLAPFDIVIGTHALLNKDLSFDKVGLVIIDEQHRFGVHQRAVLKTKGVGTPHLLTMTATPIPRTVALVLYGELDVSVIDTMPKGRLPIKTSVVPHVKRAAGYEWIRTQVSTYGVQVYIVCPLIEESEEETMQSVRAANKEYENLRDTVFPDLRVALLHGKMKASDKERVMHEFKERKHDILVSTSVVEVGIDVPNATVMIIEGAERFGLAQLHQLRGRVGRGEKQSYCFLFTSTQDEQGASRLRYFAKTTSGIKLAHFDMKIRGPGEVYGSRQHGYTDLKVASLSNYPLIHRTQEAAEYVLHNSCNLEDLPALKQRIDSYRTVQITRD